VAADERLRGGLVRAGREVSRGPGFRAYTETPPRLTWGVRRTTIISFRLGFE